MVLHTNEKLHHVIKETEWDEEEGQYLCISQESRMLIITCSSHLPVAADLFSAAADAHTSIHKQEKLITTSFWLQPLCLLNLNCNSRHKSSPSLEHTKSISPTLQPLHCQIKSTTFCREVKNPDCKSWHVGHRRLHSIALYLKGEKVSYLRYI